MAAELFAHPVPGAVTRPEAVQEAVASAAAEGLTPSDSCLRLLQQWAAGGCEIDDVVASLVRPYRDRYSA